MKEYRLTVRVNADLRRRLASTAKKHGKPQAQIVRDLLDARLDRDPKRRRESAYDVMKRLGLIGMIKDGPPDLSTNPKYFEGFGES
jgi:hypothetical protein